jgi:hypothetical protein
MFVRRKPLGVFLHDGSQWHALVYRFKRGDWRPDDTARFEAPNAEHLPDEMLAWADDQGARRVRAAVHGEVHTVSTELPPDAEPEEAHTAIAYEVASEMGSEAHLLRVSAARADRYRVGGDADTFLVVAHEQMLLERYREDCARHGLKFDGVSPLELAALARHARESAGGRLLILRRHAGFLAVPAGEENAFFCSDLAFGALPAADSARESERLAQSERVFRVLSHTPIHVVTCRPLGQERIGELRKALGDETELHVESMEDFAPRMLRHVVWSSPGGTDQGCALVGLPPEKKDPARAGTWACAATVVLTALTLAWLWASAIEDLDAVRQRNERWEALVAARQAATQQYEGSLRQRDDLVKVHTVLASASPMCPGILRLLGVLRTSMPPHTRLSAITQAGDEMEVKGKALWPRGAALLAEAMADAMRPHGYRVEPGGLAVDDAEGERAFSYRLVPTGGARP